jgi:hypothetical protein
MYHEAFKLVTCCSWAKLKYRGEDVNSFSYYSPRSGKIKPGNSCFLCPLPLFWPYLALVPLTFPFVQSQNNFRFGLHTPFKERPESQVPVVHACNCSYSGGRDQEHCGSKPARANSSQDPIVKRNPSRKRAGGVAQGEGPEFEPQYHKKKKGKKERAEKMLLQ